MRDKTPFFNSSNEYVEQDKLTVSRDLDGKRAAQTGTVVALSEHASRLAARKVEVSDMESDEQQNQSSYELVGLAVIVRHVFKL